LRPHHRRDLPGLLVVKIGPYYVEFRMNEGFDARIPFPVVLVHRFDSADQHSYLMNANDGRAFLVVNSSFFRQTGNLLILVSVTQIDPVARIATINLSLEVMPPPGTGTRGTGTGTTGTGTRTGTGTGGGEWRGAGLNEDPDSLLRGIRFFNDVPIVQWDMGTAIELHRRLLSPAHPYAGQFRTDAGVVRLNGKVLKELPPPSESVRMADAAFKQLNEAVEGTHSTDWVSVARETMLRLLEAHPFKDGNGRFARAVVTWLLTRGGYEVKSNPGVYCRQHVDAYYRALAMATHRGHPACSDALPDERKLWDQFFSEMVHSCFKGPRSPETGTEQK
jgi:fido (protein-threonine AMPylation protein)